MYQHIWVNATVLITLEAKEEGALQEYSKVASRLYKKLSEEKRRESCMSNKAKNL